MSATESTADPLEPTGPNWLSGVIAGLIAAVIVGIVIWLGFDAAIIEEDIPDALGQSGAAAGWVVLLAIGILVGLIYAGLNAIPAIDEWASTAQTGAILGLGYGLILWVVAVIVVPLINGDGIDGIGDYAVTFEGVLGYALLGVIIGFVYLLVPVLQSRQ